MPYEVETTPAGRRSTDRSPIVAATTSTTDNMWITLLSIFFTALVVGGIVYLYQQNIINGLRADYQLQIERSQNQIRDMQLKQDIQLTGVPSK
jgi:hypothetical protein